MIIILQGDNMQKFINIDPLEPGLVTESIGLLQDPIDYNTVGAEVQDDNNSLLSGTSSHQLRSTMDVLESGDSFSSTGPPNNSTYNRSSQLSISTDITNNNNNNLTNNTIGPVSVSSTSSRAQRNTKEPKSLKK
jgi:hypothetical protein